MDTATGTHDEHTVDTWLGNHVRANLGYFDRQLAHAWRLAAICGQVAALREYTVRSGDAQLAELVAPLEVRAEELTGHLHQLESIFQTLIELVLVADPSGDTLPAGVADDGQVG